MPAEPLLKNAAYTDEYFDIMNALGGDAAGRRAAYAYMQASTAIVHHEPVASGFVPRLYDTRTRRIMREAAETMHRILCKVIERFIADAGYRDIFDYDPRLVELILAPRGYDAALPFARFDIFLDEDTGDVAFCELNGDGSTGMNEDREVLHSIENSATFREFARRHRVSGCELFDAWVAEFIRIYGTYERRVDRPRFAVCDYLENSVVDELHRFARLFREQGIPCTVCDVRSLSFDGEALRDADGMPVHAVWRRCVTNDVLAQWDASQALIAAVKAQKVALIGSFAGHIVHDKQIFKALRHPATQALLTPEEAAFVERSVPATFFLDEREIDLSEVVADKDAWVVKPTDSYGAADVHVGCAYDQGEWGRIVERFANGAAGHPFLAQRFITPFKTRTVRADDGAGDAPGAGGALGAGDAPGAGGAPGAGAPGAGAAGAGGAPGAGAADEGVRYNNLEGLYCYNGRFQGVFSRLGPHPTICGPMQGITAATVWVED